VAVFTIDQRCSPLNQFCSRCLQEEKQNVGLALETKVLVLPKSLGFGLGLENSLVYITAIDWWLNSIVCVLCVCWCAKGWDGSVRAQGWSGPWAATVHPSEESWGGRSWGCCQHCPTTAHGVPRHRLWCEQNRPSSKPSLRRSLIIHNKSILTLFLNV